jgi:hypothetical protein
MSVTVTHGKPDAMTVDSTLRKPPTGISRALFRAPIALYRCRLGWLMGDRLILIEHRGRRTGRGPPVGNVFSSP